MGPFPHDAPRATITPTRTPPAPTASSSSSSPIRSRRRCATCSARWAMPTPPPTRPRRSSSGSRATSPMCSTPSPAAMPPRSSTTTGPAPRRWPGGWSMREHALRPRGSTRGAEPYDGPGKTLDVPAIIGIGGSLIYFIDDYWRPAAPTTPSSTGSARPHPEGVGFYYLDHLTHNVHRATWTPGSASTATSSISARSASSTSRASSPACSAAR